MNIYRLVSYYDISEVYFSATDNRPEVSLHISRGDSIISFHFIPCSIYFSGPDAATKNSKVGLIWKTSNWKTTL